MAWCQRNGKSKTRVRPGLAFLAATVRAEDPPEDSPITRFVSRQGDHSDGRTWRTAFHTIEAALDAVPADAGGHRIIIRPDTYPEANLDSKHKGAAGKYNVLEGDWDGRLGSGATGWVVIDSGAPDVVVRTNPQAGTANPTFMVLTNGNPALETGLKSVDWWGPWRCDPNHSAVGWDRWTFRRLYCTGSEGGVGWDLTCEAGRQGGYCRSIKDLRGMNVRALAVQVLIERA